MEKYCTKYVSIYQTYRFRVEYQWSRVCTATYTPIALNMITELPPTPVFFCICPITFTV
jgi:hypothetical protein